MSATRPAGSAQRSSALDFDALRDRHRLGEVVRRSGVSLPADAGGDVWVSCPMPEHDDTTPSMLLHLDDGRFNCFGCGAHGDVVQWVRGIYQVPLRQAAAMLEQPGALPPPPPGTVVDRHRGARRGAERPALERTATTRVRDALAAAWGYYTFEPLHRQALRYLAGRGIDVQALEAQVGRPLAGHTPHRRADQLAVELQRRGFSADELVDAGLARRYDDGRMLDAYRDRLLVAVRDDSDQVVGLIGRYDGPADDVAKYLNPPRTVVYDKSVNLYRPTLQRLDDDAQVVLCEGTLDALAIAACAAQGGLSAKYAPVVESGLAISPAQWDTILAIHHQPLVICADGDPAGRQASARWATEAALRGRQSVITTWPEGHDPASWLAAHGERGLAAVTWPASPEHAPEAVIPGSSDQMVVEHLAGEARRGGSCADQVVLEPLAVLGGDAQQHYAAIAARWLASDAREAAEADTNDPVSVVTATVAWGRERFPARCLGQWDDAAVAELRAAGYVVRREGDVFAVQSVAVERGGVGGGIGERASAPGKVPDPPCAGSPADRFGARAAMREGACAADIQAARDAGMDLWAVAGAMRGGASFAEVRHAHEAGVALPAYARERTAGHEHHEVLRYRGVAVARDARSGVNTGLDVVPPAPRLSVSAVER